MTTRNKIQEAKEKISQVIGQAKTFVKIPNIPGIPGVEERRRMTNERILNNLRKLGVATQDEVEELRLRVEKLESSRARSKADA